MTEWFVFGQGIATGALLTYLLMREFAGDGSGQDGEGS